MTKFVIRLKELLTGIVLIISNMSLKKKIYLQIVEGWYDGDMKWKRQVPSQARDEVVSSASAQL